MKISENLLKILRCPACKGEVKLKGDKLKGTKATNTKLVCSKCKAVYEVKDNIPIMLVK